MQQLERLILPHATAGPYAYDQRGNRLSDGTASYGYDAANRLTRVTSGSTSASSSYDALDHLVRQEVGGRIRQVLWDERGPSGSGAMVAECDDQHQVQTRSLLDARGVVAQTAAGTTHRLLRDRLGSTLGIVAEGSSTLAERSHYDAFGTLQGGPTTPTSTYRFAGQRAAAGALYQMRARW